MRFLYKFISFEMDFSINEKLTHPAWEGGGPDENIILGAGCEEDEKAARCPDCCFQSSLVTKLIILF